MRGFYLVQNNCKNLLIFAYSYSILTVFLQNQEPELAFCFSSVHKFRTRGFFMSKFSTLRYGGLDSGQFRLR